MASRQSRKVFPSEDGIIRSAVVFDGTQRLVRDPRQLLNLECDVPEEGEALEHHLEDSPEDGPREEPFPDVPAATPDVLPSEEQYDRPKRAAAHRQRQLMRKLVPKLIENE